VVDDFNVSERERIRAEIEKIRAERQRLKDLFTKALELYGTLKDGESLSKLVEAEKAYLDFTGTHG
jgi:hypothetical protein